MFDVAYSTGPLRIKQVENHPGIHQFWKRGNLIGGSGRDVDTERPAWGIPVWRDTSVAGTAGELIAQVVPLAPAISAQSIRGGRPHGRPSGERTPAPSDSVAQLS